MRIIIIIMGVVYDWSKVILLTMNTIPIGHTVRVVAFCPGSEGFRYKLLALGLTPGVCLTVLRVAPLGDPIQVRVRGCLLSLRKKECEKIEVEYVEKPCGDCSCRQSELRKDYVI